MKESNYSLFYVIIVCAIAFCLGLAVYHEVEMDDRDKEEAAFSAGLVAGKMGNSPGTNPEVEPRQRVNWHRGWTIGAYQRKAK